MVKTQESATALNSVKKPQKKFRHGLNLNESQTEGTPTGLKHEIIIVPSTNTPSYGSMFILDLRLDNQILHNITLQFNLSSLGGYTNSGTSPNFTSQFFIFSRIEILQAGNVIDTIYPTQEFIMQQFLNDENDRSYINNAVGNYSSAAQRYALSNATSNYFVNLRTYFDQCHPAILSNSHHIQLRVYMDTLANQVIKGAATGTTPTCTINFCNAICKITRLTPQIAQEKMSALQKSPTHHFFHDCRYGLFSVLTGVSSTQLVLTPIVGKVAVLFFVVRDQTSLSGANYYNFKAIKDFAVLNSASTNIVGGQVIPSALALNYLNLFWSASSYSQETALGITDNNANAYCWSFSSAPFEALNKGLLLGSHQFTGAEQLQINFAAQLTGNVNVDVYALTESMIEMTYNNVKKISL